MTRTMQITLPAEDWSFLMDLAKVRCWTASEKKPRKAGVAKGLEDIKAGRVYHADTVAEMKAQIFG